MRIKRVVRGALRCLLGCVCVLLAAAPAFARVERVEVTQRETVLGGKTFGAAGAYERITGKVYFSLDVSNPHNAQIVDLKNAVNLKNGAVEMSADFVAVRPVDESKGNGSMILEVPNRGNAGLLRLVDGGDEDLAHDAGDGWLLSRGFTIVSLGWQADAAGEHALHFDAPIAKDHGKTITGLVRGDLMPSHTMDEIPLGHLIVGRIGGREYTVADPSDKRNVLTMRTSREAKRQVIPHSQWQFAHTVDGKLEPSNAWIHLNGGFKPGLIYEYVYLAQNPVVAGGGFAAIRDFAAYAKHDAEAVAPAKRVYGQGISQNGRFLRDFLYEGFNADEEGRMALDGVLAHVAGAGRGSFNYRFAQPSRDAQPTSSIDFPTDIFPFTDEPETDPVTHVRAGLLDAARREHVAPKIFFSNTSYEYWGRAEAITHVTPDGKHDAVPGPEVRIYHFTGLQHFSVPFPPQKGRGDLLGQQRQTPLPVKYFWRAMIANMDAWVRDDTLPPPSAYPRIANGTLVPLVKWKFPAIPGVNKPYEANAGERLDFGPDWRAGVMTWQPPKRGRDFPVLVPQTNVDGNEMDGVRLPEITVPLATYTGWNLRDPSIGAPRERVSFEGSFLPFARTKAEREKAGDPRLSIAERYSGRSEYLRKFDAAVDALVKERWILPEDKAALEKRGAEEWDVLTGASGDF
ncbi:MAG TPA: alpha/beta hydrolase domain-containing protein [Terracidiphilus sp.]|nr:alpha/beta hydrolase domain-containing protein [Terracidiphilus sp.]